MPLTDSPGMRGARQIIPVPGRPITGFRKPVLVVDADVDDEDTPALDVLPPFSNAAVEPDIGRRRTNLCPIAGGRRKRVPLPVPDVLPPTLEPEDDDVVGKGAGPPIRFPSGPKDDDFRCFNSILWIQITNKIAVAGRLCCPLFKI